MGKGKKKKKKKQKATEPYFAFWKRSLPSGTRGLQHGLSFRHCRRLAARDV